MDLVTIESALFLPTIYINASILSSFRLAHTTSAPGGALSLDTRRYSVTNNNSGWPDGRAQFDPSIFKSAYTVCHNRLIYGIVPDYCTAVRKTTVQCDGDLDTCAINGEIDGTNTVARLCWEHTGKSSIVVLGPAGPTTLPYSVESACIPLGDLGISASVTRSENHSSVTISGVRQESYDNIGFLLAFLLGFLVILWNELPRKQVYSWIDTDIVIVPMCINWARHTRSPLFDCTQCSSRVCSFLCSFEATSCIWVLIGLVLPFAVVATLSRHWPVLQTYTAPSFTSGAIEIILIASSLMQLPLHRIYSEGAALLQYAVSGSLCVIAGRCAGKPHVSKAESVLMVLTAAVVNIYSALHLLWTPLESHPSLLPDQFDFIISTAFVLTSTATLGGYYAAKCNI